MSVSVSVCVCVCVCVCVSLEHKSSTGIFVAIDNTLYGSK